MYISTEWILLCIFQHDKWHPYRDVNDANLRKTKLYLQLILEPYRWFKTRLTNLLDLYDGLLN